MAPPKKRPKMYRLSASHSSACSVSVRLPTVLSAARPLEKVAPPSPTLTGPCCVLPDVRIVPILVGWQTADTAVALGGALASVLRGQRAIIVASTDLSHYHAATVSAGLDGIVIECVRRFDPEALQQALDRNPGHACGGGAVVAAMRAARALGACDAVVLDYGDSGDITGDKSSVVGYLAAALGRGRHRPERSLGG